MFGVADNKEFLKAIGIDNAPQDVKERLISGIEELARQDLIIALSEKLSDAEAEEFGAITDEDQAYNWLMQHVPDFNTIVAGILTNIGNDIIARGDAVLGQQPEAQQSEPQQPQPQAPQPQPQV